MVTVTTLTCVKKQARDLVKSRENREASKSCARKYPTRIGDRGASFQARMDPTLDRVDKRKKKKGVSSTRTGWVKKKGR